MSQKFANMRDFGHMTLDYFLAFFTIPFLSTHHKSFSSY